jgi:hypothetical protein
MQKTVNGILALIAMLLLTSSVLPNQILRRVKFQRGRTTAVLKGRIVRGSTDRYLLGAKAGQTMLVHITSPTDTANFSVSSKDGSAVDEDAVEVADWTGELPTSGDYVISVRAGMLENTKYTLEVTIR